VCSMDLALAIEGAVTLAYILVDVVRRLFSQIDLCCQMASVSTLASVSDSTPSGTKCSFKF
jgi:hypothetical protein